MMMEEAKEKSRSDDCPLIEAAGNRAASLCPCLIRGAGATKGGRTAAEGVGRRRRGPSSAFPLPLTQRVRSPIFHKNGRNCLQAGFRWERGKTRLK